MCLSEGLHEHPEHGPSPSLEGETGALSNIQAPAVTRSLKTKHLDRAVLMVVMKGLLTSFCMDLILVSLSSDSGCVATKGYSS